MKDIEYAKELLVGSKTCILVKTGTVLTSEKKGIAPVLDFIEEGRDITGYSVADRIVGKAAAMLFIKAGLKEVYAEVLSNDGAMMLDNYHIPYTYGTLVNKIINRQGTDICPMKKTVKDITDINQGIQALKNKVAQLKQANS